MKYNFIAALPLFTLVLSVAPCFGQDHAADDKAIRQGVAQYVGLWNNEKPAVALESVVSSDFQHVTAAGSRLTGAKALSDAIKAFQADPHKPKLTASVEKVQFLSDTIALVTGTWRTTWGKERPSDGAWMAVAMKSGSRWISVAAAQSLASKGK